MTVNGFHNGFLDRFFYWVTFFGDGLTFALVIIVLLFLTYRQAILGLVIFLGTAGLTQFLKRVVFADHLRPVGRLGREFDLYLPAGVEPLMNNSFPSGHTTTAFALATFLTLVLRQKNWWPVFLGLAILTGYSRVYLTHHFPIDVWVGSVIGTLGAVLLFWWLEQPLENRFGDKGLWKRL